MHGAAAGAGGEAVVTAESPQEDLLPAPHPQFSPSAWDKATGRWSGGALCCFAGGPVGKEGPELGGSCRYIITSSPREPPGHCPGVPELWARRPSEGVSPGRRADASVGKAKLETEPGLSHAPHLRCSSFFLVRLLSRDIVSLVPFYPVLSRGGSVISTRTWCFTDIALLQAKVIGDEKKHLTFPHHSSYFVVLGLVGCDLDQLECGLALPSHQQNLSTDPKCQVAAPLASPLCAPEKSNAEPALGGEQVSCSGAL